MIAPYDPHARSAAVLVGDFSPKFACRSAKRAMPPRAAASTNERRSQCRKKSKGMMIIPLDPSGFSALVAAGGRGVIFWGISMARDERSRGGAGGGPGSSENRPAVRRKFPFLPPGFAFWEKNDHGFYVSGLQRSKRKSEPPRRRPRPVRTPPAPSKPQGNAPHEKRACRRLCAEGALGLAAHIAGCYKLFEDNRV